MKTSNSSTKTQRLSPGNDVNPTPFKPSFQIYAIVFGLGIANLLAALENTVLTIAAPVIFTDLQLGDSFIWVTNAFFLSRYVFQHEEREKKNTIPSDI